MNINPQIVVGFGILLLVSCILGLLMYKYLHPWFEDENAYPKHYTIIRMNFRDNTQTPFFMIWKEWWDNGEITFATVLYMTKF